MAEPVPQNPLLSSSRPSDTSPHIQLHPLVLLTISDYITRHSIRQFTYPIVGAILGQQNGREITMEVAFEAKLTQDLLLDEEWFKSRVEQYKEVFKVPQLDLVGWFTLGSSGPQQHHLPIHTQIQQNYNESAVLLLFQPEAILSGSMTGGKLPVSLYESIWTNADVGSGGMEVEGAQSKALKFQELTYSVETGEAEMISVDFVAKGGGNATAVEEKKKSSPDSKEKGKGKAKDGDAKVNGTDEPYLSGEDEELIASLTARLNATKMLHARLTLLSKYLSSLPPSYLSDQNLPMTAESDSSQATISHPILRTLLATLSRLPLLVPPSSSNDRAGSSFEQEAQSGRSDVALVQLLSTLTESVADAKELGRKSEIVNSSRSSGRSQGNFPSMSFSGDPFGDGMASPENEGGQMNILNMITSRFQ